MRLSSIPVALPLASPQPYTDVTPVWGKYQTALFIFCDRIWYSPTGAIAPTRAGSIAIAVRSAFVLGEVQDFIATMIGNNNIKTCPEIKTRGGQRQSFLLIFGQVDG